MRSFEANGCYRVQAGSYVGWTFEQNRHPLMFTRDPNYPMMHRPVARSDLPRSGSTYTFRDGQSLGISSAVYSVAVDIGQSKCSLNKIVLNSTEQTLYKRRM